MMQEAVCSHVMRLYVEAPTDEARAGFLPLKPQMVGERPALALSQLADVIDPGHLALQRGAAIMRL